MEHKSKTYTAAEAKRLSDKVGDIDSSPKHLKREILALKMENQKQQNLIDALVDEIHKHANLWVSVMTDVDRLYSAVEKLEGE